MIDPKELPDSRLRWARGMIRHPALGNLSRVFCIVCGKPAGAVSEHFFKKAVSVCDDCASRLHGRFPMKPPQDHPRATCIRCGADGGPIHESLVGCITYLCDACEIRFGKLPLKPIPEAVVRPGGE